MVGHRQLSAAEYLGIWQRRRKWALLGLLLGLAGGYALSRMLPAKYTSTATVQETSVAASLRTEAPVPEPSASRVVALREQVLTPERLQRLAGQFGLYPAEQNKDSAGAPVVEMSRRIALAPSATGFTISFTAGDARVAQQVCAGIVSLFLQEERKGRPQDAVGDSPSGIPTAEFVAKQLSEAKRNLDAQEAKLAAFKRRHGGEPSGDDEAEAQNRLMGYNVQLEAANGALNSALQERTALTASIQAIESAGTQARPAAEPPNVLALEQELDTEQAQLVTLEARYTPDHPDVVKLRTDIAQLQRKIDEAKRAAAAPRKSDAMPAVEPPQVAQMRAQVQELDRTVQEKTAEQSRLKGEIQAARARLENGPALEQEYKQLTRDREAAQTNYNTLLAKQSEMMKAIQSEGRRERSAFRVVEPANLPAAPSFPNPILFTLGGAGGGFGVGLLVVVLGELRDKTLRTESDIEHYLELPTLAVIPTADGPGGKDSEGRGGSRAVRSENGEKEESVLADV